MKYFFFLLGLCISSIACFAQITDDVVKANLAKQFREFISKGHDVIDTAVTDFNDDGLIDLALVTTDTTDANVSRTIIILQKTSTGYTLSTHCDAAILCKECGGVFGDPYSGISFTKNVLKIHHYGGSAWRWSDNYTFRFQNNQWELIGISSNSYWNLGDCEGGVGAAGQNMREVNFSTKKMHVIKTKETNCKPYTDKWVTIKSYQKVTLASFNVEEDYFKPIVVANR